MLIQETLFTDLVCFEKGRCDGILLGSRRAGGYAECQVERPGLFWYRLSATLFYPYCKQKFEYLIDEIVLKALFFLRKCARARKPASGSPSSRLTANVYFSRYKECVPMSILLASNAYHISRSALPSSFQTELPRAPPGGGRPVPGAPPGSDSARQGEVGNGHGRIFNPQLKYYSSFSKFCILLTLCLRKLSKNAFRVMPFMYSSGCFCRQTIYLFII